MTKLLKLKMTSTFHKTRFLWIDPSDGTMYYGADENNLIFPEGGELLGFFPTIYLEDLKNAFLLGKEYGKEEGK